MKAPRPSVCAALVFALAWPLAGALSAEPTSESSIAPGELGAAAQRHYQGDGIGIEPTVEGAHLRARLQKLEAAATRDGLWLTSTEKTPALGSTQPFRIRAASVGRLSETTAPASLADTGEVRVTQDKALWLRPGLVEEYSVSVDGVRQDFVVLARPAGAGAELRVRFDVSGATVASAAYGARLTLGGAGREIAYSRLHVTDATGRTLGARMEVDAANRLSVVVNDAAASYPVRIDPTFSDADWVSLNSGVPGAYGVTSPNIKAIAVDGSGNLYVGGIFTAIGAVAANRVAKWDGSNWSALGSGVGDFNSYVNAMAVLGNDLYVGGFFQTAGGVAAKYLAKWNGTAWSAMGTSPNSEVSAIVVSGTNLYIAGFFQSVSGTSAKGIARWNGSAWSALGSGLDGGSVRALAVSGTDVYAGGFFTSAGGAANTAYLARWNGSAWSALGSGVDDGVVALAVSGTDVYAGGVFTAAGGVADTDYLAKWNGSAWAALGTGVNSNVFSLAVSGTDLYVGGQFNQAGGVTAYNIAKWSGTAWSALSDGTGGPVYAIHAVSGGVLVGGLFGSVSGGNVAATAIAQWNGSAWSAYGSGFDGAVNAVAVLGSDVYVGGSFLSAPGVAAKYIARWNGTTWSAVGSGSGVGGVIRAMVVSGSDLYVGGDFQLVDGAACNRVAKWNGTTWSPLGLGVGDSFATVFALTMMGGDLYVGGDFNTAGSGFASNIAKWNGTTWSALGSGTNGDVLALSSSGSNVYAGGAFSTAGGTTVNRVARWNGSAWSALGTGLSSSGSVSALLADGGNVYVGGSFSAVSGVSASRIAKWNGSAWSALGAGMSGSVRVLSLHNGILYAGGFFFQADGIDVNAIAKWNGFVWQPMGSGVDGNVLALGINAANQMFVGGSFFLAGTTVSPYIAQANLGTVVPGPELSVSGSNRPISNGDVTPSILDGTDFGSATAHNAQITRTFAISSTGTQALTLNGSPLVQITGAAANDFKVITEPASSLAVGTSTSLIIAFDPTQPGPRTAVVSLSSDDASAAVFTFTITGEGLLTTQRTQTLTFAPPATVYLGQSPLALTAWSSSGLPVTLSVLSGPASISGNSLSLSNVGTVKVQATQAGNSSYKAATAVTRTLTVKANPTALTLINLNQIYDGTPRPVSTLGGSGPVTITYKNGTLYNDVVPFKAGSHSVKAVSGGVTKTGTLVIAKAPLYVTPEDKRRFVGQANPLPTVAYSGFVNGESTSVLTKLPTFTFGATTASPGGLYAITAKGATAENYSFIYRPGSLVVESFAGAYEALLLDSNPLPVGRLSLTVVANNKTFTGKLYAATEPAALSLSGPLLPDLANERLTGTVSVTPKGSVPYATTFTLPLTGNMLATVTRNALPFGTATDGRKLLALPASKTVAYSGAHTVVLDPALPATSTVPVGAGWATAKISTAGVIALAGQMGDGVPFTASLPPDMSSHPSYRLFVQPYLKARADAYLGGAFTLAPHPTLANRRYVALAGLTWRKTGLLADPSYRGGFGPVSTALTLDPWLPPVKATSTTFAVTLPSRLGLIGSNFTVAHSATGSAVNGNLPTRVAISSTNAVSVLLPVTTPANSTKWTTTLDVATGKFTGSFELVDGTQKRPVKFTGVLRQPPSSADPVIGDGNYLLPALTGAPSNEKVAGEVLFTRP